MLHIELTAGELKGMSAEELLSRQHLPNVVQGLAVAVGLGEVRAVVGEDGMASVRNGCDQRPQKVSGDASRGFLVEFNEGELRGPVDRQEEVELAVLGPRFGDVDLEEADRAALKRGALRSIAVRVRQSRNAMALPAAVQ